MATVRRGILGGTFDPPHYGHLMLAEQAREQLGLACVSWVPAGDPWRKTGTPISAAQHRLAMLRLAVEGNDSFQIDTREVERGGPSYTVDTLALIHEQHPEQELFFLLGADALSDLPNWHNPAKLIEIASLGAAARGGKRIPDSILETLLPSLCQRLSWFAMPRLDISATDLRTRAAKGESLRYFCPPAVAAYITSNKLYTPA